MSVRLRILLAAALLMGGGVLGYQAFVAHKRAQEQLTDWQARRELQRPLEKIVTIQFGREVTLPEWFDEFTRQTGLNLVLDLDTMSRQYVGDDYDNLLGGEVRFELDLPPMPASEALRTLSEYHDIHWLQRSDGSLEWRRSADSLPLFTRVYTVPPDLHLKPADVAELISSNVTPDRWEDVGGPGSIQPSAGAVTILQSLDVQDRTDKFLARLFAALRQIRRATPAGLGADDPVWKPICLDGEPADIAALEAALERPITIKANHVKAQDFVESLSQQVRFPIGVHGPAEITKPNISLVNFTCDLQGVPLREVLREVGFHELMGFAPAASGRMLILCPLDSQQTVNHQILYAYPVADFAATAAAESGGAREGVGDLQDLIESSIDTDSWQSVGGPGSVKAIAEDKLLLIWQTLDNHRQIRELLAGLRALRSGHNRKLALELERKLPANVPVLNARLNEPCEFHYRESLLLDAVRDVSQRTGVSFPVFELSLDKKKDQIWCHLPTAPLRENLQLLIAATDHDYYTFEMVSELATPWLTAVDDERLFTTEIFDLRPRLVDRGGPILTDLIGSTLEPDNWADVGGPGSLDLFRNNLVVYAHPRTLARVRDMLSVLEEHLASRSPKVWRGEPLTAEALNQPLEFRSPADPIFQRQTALAARDEVIRQKLRELVSIELPEQNLGAAILAVAKQFELPIVLHQLPKHFDPARDTIQLSVKQEPLGSVLQQLVGDPEKIIWHVDGGYLTVVAPHEVADQETGFLYSVDDLLVPRGKLLPGQLIRTIHERLENTDGDIDGPYPENRIFPTAHAWLHFGNLFELNASPAQPGRAIVEDILRRLRNGDLKPLARKPGDERYYHHPIPHPHFAAPQPVFGM